MTFKLTQVISNHAIQQPIFLFVFHCNYVCAFHRFLDIITYFLNLKTSRDCDHSRDSL